MTIPETFALLAVIVVKLSPVLIPMAIVTGIFMLSITKIPFIKDPFEKWYNGIPRMPSTKKLHRKCNNTGTVHKCQGCKPPHKKH